jgi:hypothetical protein
VRHSFLLAIMAVVAMLQLSPTFACGIGESDCRAAAAAPAASMLDVLPQSPIWWVAGVLVVLLMVVALIGPARRRAQ